MVFVAEIHNEEILQDPPNPSLPLDLLWADPDIHIKQFKFSIRYVRISYLYSVLIGIVCVFVQEN